MVNKITLVLGASLNDQRYSNMAIKKLQASGISVLAVGKIAGYINQTQILTHFPTNKNIDTVTLYLNENNQKPYYENIMQLQPRRIIFNPGTENSELKKLAHQNNILTIEACTLVMLSTGLYE